MTTSDTLLEYAAAYCGSVLVLNFMLLMYCHKRWAYITVVTDTFVGLILASLQIVLIPKNVSEELFVLVFAQAGLLVWTVIATYIKFQTSLRAMLIHVCILMTAATLVWGPHMRKVHASTQVIELLRKKQPLNALFAIHTHAGRICRVDWAGPIAQADFDLIMVADPIKGVVFHDTVLTPEQDQAVKQLMQDRLPASSKHVTDDGLTNSRFAE